MWKVLLLIVVYLAFYLAVGQVTSRVFADQIDTDNVVASASSILLGVALPIAIGGIALLVFTTKVGWLRGRLRPTTHSWAGVGCGSVRSSWSPPLLRILAGTDWGAWTTGEVIALLVLGACVGLTEELATRGLAVKMLRDAGHRERFVAVVSSLVFALMHTVNLIAGMKASTVLVTVVYTFGFGMCMYLDNACDGHDLGRNRVTRPHRPHHNSLDRRAGHFGDHGK